MSSLRLAIKLSLADGDENEGGGKIKNANGSDAAKTLTAAPAAAQNSATTAKRGGSPPNIAAPNPKAKGPRTSSTTTGPGKGRTAAATSVTPTPKAGAGAGCSLRLAIKKSLEDEEGAVPAKISPYTSSISSQSLSSTDADSSGSLGGKGAAAVSISAHTSGCVKLAPKASVGGMPQTTQPSVAAHKASIPARGKSPMLYLGIALERPESVDSWGLVFSKDKTSSALIVRVITPNVGEEGPSVKWSRVSQSSPNPALLYQAPSTSMPLEEYESCLARQFPPTCEDRRLQEAGILAPLLSPGDAIISVNGINVSSFPSMGAFASYIRQNCQRTLVLVAMRHEYVWAAARAQFAPLVGPGQVGQEQHNEPGSSAINQQTTDRVATAVRAAWRILAGADSSRKRKAPTTNEMFKDGQGRPIPYCDNNDSGMDGGGRLRNFINDEIETSFHKWLDKRKATWRKECWPEKYTNCNVGSIADCEGVSSVQHDFWVANGYDSFEQWLQVSKSNWARHYSWHKERLEALQTECEREVTIGNHALLPQFENWLSARKQQWRLERRKRQRQRVEMSDVSMEEYLAAAGDCSPSDPAFSATTNVYMDELLDKERDQELAAATNEEGESYPMDISWVFDSALGAPDDIIANLLGYLCPSDHGNLLCLSYTSNFLFKQRQDMWQSLCPKHWVLPRRPRKSWAALYISKIRAEEEASRKRSDDLLVKANTIIEKADQLNKLEKLIRKAEKDFDFAVNYTSGVVLERNSLLNLAVIEGRHKITKWLIEEKEADIESCDRGRFTPLMNAAWSGDKYIVRYLLSKGCDRTKIGYNHSSEGLAPATFEGLTAEGWARKRGHDDVAELIRFGL